MHQVISIHIGQCGLQVGSAVWELLTFEHSINNDGTLYVELISSGEVVDSFFNNCAYNKFVPRALFVDSEPSVIDQMRTGSYKQLFHPDQLINGYEEAGNNFARGLFTSGRIIKNLCRNRLRMEMEMSDNLNAIHIYRSLGGGTGSGMTANLLEILSEISKITIFEIPIHPSPNLSCATVEPYNCILAEHYCMDDIDLTMLMDNEALYDVLSNEISFSHPTLSNMNRIIAQISSSVTSSSRFSNNLSNDFTIMTNLVPYPRIHYPLVSYAPFGNSLKLEREINSVFEITRSVFRLSNQLVKCDLSTGKYMSCSLLYRGLINPSEVNEALGGMKSSSAINFVDWCPTGFKVGIVNQQPQILPESKLGITSRNVIMMTNNSAISVIWYRLSQNFHRLYSKRSFVHWFVSEGLEETEFCESLFNIATLAKDYEEVCLDTETCDKIIEDLSENSNPITNSSKKKDYNDILVTPVNLLKSYPRTSISGFLIKTIDKVIENDESHDRTMDIENLNESLGQQPIEENRITVVLDRNIIGNEVCESETEIKSIVLADTETNNDIAFLNDISEIEIETKNILVWMKNVYDDDDDDDEKTFEEIVKLEIKEDEDFEYENYNNKINSQNNFCNAFSNRSYDTKLKTNHDVRNFIQTLSFSSHGNGFRDSCFYEKINFKENKCFSRSNHINRKSILNQRCCSSLDNRGNDIEDERTHSLMEELSRITA